MPLIARDFRKMIFPFCLDQGLNHAACVPHVARDDILCGPQCFSGIFK